MAPRTRQPYPAEYRQKILELVRSGRSPESLEKEFEPTATTIRNWMKQAELDAGLRDDGLTTLERQELARLRRENRNLKEERDILKKAAAWFAQEATSTRKKGSSS